MNRVEAPDSDEALMMEAASGGLQAFERLVQRHQNRVYRMARQMLGNEDDAWDASQDIFIKLYNARHSYSVDAKFTTWLYRIANNAIIDKIRQHKRSQNTSSLEDGIQEPESNERSIHHHVAHKELKGQLSLALANLSDRQRSMVILKYYEGFSVNEIAEMFECAAGTVKATLFQAVKHLRDGLARSGVVNAEVTP